MKKQTIYALLFVFLSINVFGWSGETHKSLTYYSWRKSDKLGDMEFLLRLNLDKGMLGERLSDSNEIKNPDEWLQYGAEHEDDSDSKIPDRSNFHFHNPLKEWREAGLSDMATGSSSIFWAQNGSLQTATNNKQGDRSWNKAREYYYKALTEVQFPGWRRNYFAEMFKILGHQVHLLQDLSVPDHARNDAHILNSILGGIWKKKNNSFRCIEGWAAYNIIKVETIANYSQLKPSIDFSNPADPESPIPMALLSDTKQYKISQTPLAGLNQGLAEYTNANYFSEDTIFTEDYQHDHKHWFPHPSKLETNVMSLGMPSTVTAEDGKKDLVKPVSKSNGETLDNLVSAGYNLSYIDHGEKEYKFAFYLSDACHQEYAKKLIPRAVGYSATLLDYFFRGEIEISLPYSTNPALPQLDGIYAFSFDGSQGFRYISLMAKNVTRDNEEMTNGFVSLIVSYRKCNGDPFVPNPPFPDTERSFIKVDYPKAIDIPRNNPIRLDFDLSASPLPVNAVDVNLTLVFHGFLGGEFANAVAVGFKDVSEPTPIDFFNNTDWVCYDGMYVNYDDPYLWNAVDINPKNGKIDCYKNAEIDITRKRIGQQSKGIFVYFSFNGKAANSTNYYFSYDDGWEILPGETPKRIFVLADDYPAKLNYSIQVHSQSMEKPNECFSYYTTDVDPGYPYTNKLEWVDSPDPNQRRYEHIYSPIGYFRGYPFRNLTYYANSTVPKDSVCSASASAIASSLSESSNKKSLGAPQINAVSPVKESE
jgi:hypothetical protein